MTESFVAEVASAANDATNDVAAPAGGGDYHRLTNDAAIRRREPSIAQTRTAQTTLSAIIASKMGAAALHYAQRGMAVLPLWWIENGRCACGADCGKNAGKHPIGPLVRHAVKDTTKDQETVLRWWTAYPRAHIGIATGGASGVLVLDDDPRNGGDDSLAMLREEHKELPSTLTASTGGGGRHFYFQHTVDLPNRTNAIGKGLDLKSTGGYVVAPPSGHLSGGSYDWVDVNAQLARAPDWLLGLCQIPKERPPRKGEKLEPVSINVVQQALESLASDNYTDWITTGLALKHDFGNDGLELWDTWSRKSKEKYPGRAVIEKRWRTIQPWDEGALTGRTILYRARAAGWKQKNEEGFLCDRYGNPYSDNQDNIRIALSKLGVEASHDRFADRLLITGFPGYGPMLQDETIEALWLLIDDKFQFRPGIEFFRAVVANEARKRSFHPLLEYLDSHAWDGTQRLDRWLVTYGGAEDTEYVRAVGAIALIAAVRRVRSPGCKFDEMLVLESAQGLNKSSALAVLAVREEWFSDDLPLNVDAQKVIERLQGRWIVEAAELQGMRRGEVEHIKAFLSRREDRARAAYGRVTKTLRRQSILVGTTNSDRYLRDGTGARRFWPVKVQGFDLESLKRDRDQLWAEAAAREAAKETIRLDPRLYSVAAIEQDERRAEDPFKLRLAHVLGDLTGKITTLDAFMIIGVQPGQRTEDHNTRLGVAMKDLGWERDRLRFGGSPQYCYVRGTKEERERRIVLDIERDDKGEIVRNVDGSVRIVARHEDGGTVPAADLELGF